MPLNLFNAAKIFILAFTSLLVLILPSKSNSLSEMVNQVLESHEDIINAKKELEESGRDVTDALLVYAPDLSVKYEAGSNDKYNAA